MADYKLSPRAAQRLLDIESFTSDAFGDFQADAYITGFEKTFELIAGFPGIGRSADEIAPGHRRYSYQSHHIFYTVETDHALIRNILHNSQDLKPDLFD